MQKRRTFLATFVVATAVVVAATGFGAAARAEEPSWADEYAISSLAEEAGISREEAARRLESQAAQADLAQRLAEQLKDRAAGAFIDRGTGGLVVNVLDERAAGEVRAAGATPKTVRYSQIELDDVARRIDPDSVAGRSGWVLSIGADPELNAVIVTVPESAARDAARFVEHVRSFGERVRVVFSKEPGQEFQAYDIYSGYHSILTNGNCTAGFAARSITNYRYMLTANHCVAGNNYNVYLFNNYNYFFGQRSYSAPSYDTATILNWTPATYNQLPRVWHWNSGYVTVKGQYTTLQNHYVCKSGITTGWKCGYVLGTGYAVWVAPAGMYVLNMTRAKVCSQKGDSGGPVVFKSLYNQWWATGITSLGPAVCLTGSVMHYAPVASVLAGSGLALVTG